MSRDTTGNLLLVSNYPSNTAYAWWLIEHFWISIAEHFAKRGCDVYLAYPEVTSISDNVKAAPIKVVELKIPWTTASQYSYGLRFIRERDISFIYFTDQSYFSFQYALMRFMGVQHIINHDHTPGDKPPVRGLKSILKIIKNSLPWLTVDLVICVSEHIRKRNISHACIPAQKCRVIQNGIIPIECEHRHNTELKKELGIDDNSLLVITTGRAHPYKRFDFIIDVANEYMQLLPERNVTFLLVGDGPAMPDLQKHVRNLKLENTIRLAGYRNDVRDLLCISDIAIHAALGEGFSLSIIEYMSAGLPVLVPDIASVSQAITHNKTGLVYKQDDPKEAALYIAELANNEKHRAALGNAAKAESNTLYHLENCTSSLVKTISTLHP